LTDESDQALVPQIRLRANSLNLQQTDYLTIESTGNGAASPTTTGTDYDLYFVPPANDINMLFSFDLLNFDPGDSASAGVSLHLVVIDRFALDSLTSPTVVHDYTFDTSADGWTSHAAAIVFTPPIFSNTGGALVLEATTNTGCFGYWQNAEGDIAIAPEVMYRGKFTVRTDVTSQSAVPQMRQRFNAGNLQASCVYGVESIEEGENSPTTTNTIYDKLYWVPPASAEGAALLVSFEMLNFTPTEDAVDGQLILDQVTVETLDIPSLP
jgi:hypothetical protein